MVRKKAIIFDLDGTAVDSPKKQLPPRALRQQVDRLKRQYVMCSATGRVWSFAKPVLKVLNLTDPCIISAGTQICDPVTGKILWQRTIEQKAMEKVIEVLIGYPDYKILFNDATREDYLYGGINPKEFTSREPVYFFKQVFVPDKIAYEIFDKLSLIEGVTCVMVVAQRPGCKDLHVIDELATKEHAVAKLLELVGVDKEQTIGIGDGHNDVHLFNAVGYKVVMENAVEELKQRADRVIGSVMNNGLVEYFEGL